MHASLGADINCRSFYQDSPLHIATFACASQYNKEFKVLATLIEAGKLMHHRT